MADEREARRVRAGEIRARQELARVEPAMRVDPRLVGGEGRELLRRQVFELGDADAVLARDDAARLPRERHDPRDGRVRLAQHRVIVGIDGQIRMHVAVAGVHVQRDEHPAAQVLALDFDCMRAITGANARPPKISSSGAFNSVFHDATAEPSCSEGNIASMPSVEILPARAHGGDQRARFIHLRGDFLRRRPGVVVRAPRMQRAAGPATNAASASHNLILFASESSMLIRSMPSV